MSFFLRSGWYASFLEPDLKTPLPRKFSFGDPDKMRELAQRGGALDTLEARQMLEHAIETGRGGLFLNLTEDQYGSSSPEPYNAAMPEPCPEYARLESLLESRRQELNFYHPVNEGRHGPANQAKKLYQKTEAEIVRLQTRRLNHRASCEVCKKSFAE
jgi:hypothetical protein